MTARRREERAQEVPLALSNSTIAFNTANVPNTTPFDYAWSGGLAVRASPVAALISVASAAKSSRRVPDSSPWPS